MQRDGHDVVWARIHSPGQGDEAILAQAQAERRIVITFDKNLVQAAKAEGFISIDPHRYTKGTEKSQKRG